MRVLITGATGFIGSHLAETLSARGDSIRCLVRQTSDLKWIQHLPIEYIYGDLFDPKILREAVTGMDAVYHLAGVTKARTKPEYFQGNQIATRNLLEATLEANPKIPRFIHISSQTAVGPSVNGTAVNEDSPCHPITTYGMSKLEAEKECLKLQDKLPITIIRAPAVYGPRDKDVFEFFNTMNRGLQPMIGFNDKTVSLIHVKDLVDGIVLAGGHPKAIGQTYFISSERFYDWKEVGEVTGRIMNKKAIRIRIPEFAVYAIGAMSELVGFMTRKAMLLNLEKVRDIVQQAWTCDVSKAKQDLGFHESCTLETGIKNTVEWYRKQGWL